VRFNFLFFKVRDILLEEGDHLIGLEWTLFLTGSLVVAHLLEKGLIDQLSGQFKIESVGATFADLLASVAK
jgi:hypothetical protein